MLVGVVGVDSYFLNFLYICVERFQFHILHTYAYKFYKIG